MSSATIIPFHSKFDDQKSNDDQDGNVNAANSYTAMCIARSGNASVYMCTYTETVFACVCVCVCVRSEAKQCGNALCVLEYG